MDLGQDNDCPICAEVPPGKIFQCKEGHIICESCLRRIQDSAMKANCTPKCPSCAGSLDNRAVSQNRALENLLDGLKINCPQAKNGCKAKLNRSELKAHETSCPYGVGLKVCWMFGYPNCNFQLTVNTAPTVFQHITSSHPSILFNGNMISTSRPIKKDLQMVVIKGPFYYVDILRVPDSLGYIMIYTRITKDYISFHSVDLSLGFSRTEKLRVKFSIPGNTVPVMSWSIPVACGMDSWKFLKDKDCQKPIEISVNSILQHLDQNECLPIVIKIKSG